MEVLRLREDKGPLRVPRCPRATEDLGETGRMSYRGQLLQVSKDSDVRKLVCGVDLDELEVSKLDDLMREVRADVNHHVLGTFPSADDVVSPLDASGVVLEDRCPGGLHEAHPMTKFRK